MESQQMYTENPFSKTTQKIIDIFRKEANRSIQVVGATASMESSCTPMMLNDYLLACREFLSTKNLLPDGLLQVRIQYILQDGKLKLHFPAGMRCCLAIIPCSIYGLPLEPQEVQTGTYLRVFIVDKNDRVVSGFTSGESDIFKMLPQQLQQCCIFNIGEYETGEISSISAADRNRIVNLYTTAFNNAKILFESN